MPTVNGVRIAASLTLTDYGDGRGFVPRKDRHGLGSDALYATRMDAKKGVVSSAGFEVSAAAKRKICETLPAVADEWAQRRRGLFTEVRRATVNNEIRRLQAEL